MADADDTKWYEWLIIITLLLGYSSVVLIADSLHGSWLVSWINYTAPISEFLNSFVPGTKTRLEGISDAGYAHRVPLMAHLYASAMIWGLISLFGIAPLNFTRMVKKFESLDMNSASLGGFISCVSGSGLVIYLHVVRDIVPDPSLQYAQSVTGYTNNLKALLEFYLYEVGFMLFAGGLIWFIASLIRSLFGYRSNQGDSAAE